MKSYDGEKVKDGYGYRLNVRSLEAAIYYVRVLDVNGGAYNAQLIIKR